MKPRQSVPEQWLIADDRLGADLWPALRKLALRSGVLVLRDLGRAQRRKLHHLARLRRLVIVDGGAAARIHGMRELRNARLKRTPLILISPMHETRSHPDWRPMPRMRAATLARLTGREAIALGGMNARRYGKIAQLGFIGWAGIDAFRT